MTNDKLAIVVNDSGIDTVKARAIVEQFEEFFSQAEEWDAKTKALVITDVSQTAEMKIARDARLNLKDIRVAAGKTKKRLKENIIIEGRLIDSIYNLVEAVTKPLESELLEKEKFVERQEAARKEALRADRAELLDPFGVDTSFYNLSEMLPAAFEQLLENTRLAQQARVDAQRKAEEERISREEAEAQERLRVAAENARLKKEAEAREKEIAKERKKAEAERKRAEAEARAKAEAEAKKRAEREASEREERERHEAELKAQREAAEEAQRELKEKVEAEARARAEKEAAEKRIQDGINSKKTVVIELDGNEWCAHYDDFENIQESVCGFSKTRSGALRILEEQ